VSEKGERVMMCPDCFGSGKAISATKTHILLGGYVACPTCEGKGVVHCCEGDQACKEVDLQEESNDDLRV
jgi:hypothetical protein